MLSGFFYAQKKESKMGKLLTTDDNGKVVQGFETVKRGVSDGVNVTVNGTSFPLTKYIAVRPLTDVVTTQDGQTGTYLAMSITIIPRDGSLSIAAGTVIEVM